MDQNTAARHIVRVMRSQFAQDANGAVMTDPITARPIPVTRQVELNKQTYNASSISQWSAIQSYQRQTPVVPHTRQPFSANQVRAIATARYDSRHPIHVFRDREVIAGAVKHTAVTDLMAHVCCMTDLIGDVRKGRWTNANQTIQEAFGYDRLDPTALDRYLSEVGYRLQIEKETYESAREILPVQSYGQFAQLPVGSFPQHGQSEHEFFLVPRRLSGYAKIAGLTREGVIMLSWR